MLLLTEKSRTFQDPHAKFPGPFRSPQMFKYNVKVSTFSREMASDKCMNA